MHSVPDAASAHGSASPPQADAIPATTVAQNIDRAPTTPYATTMTKVLPPKPVGGFKGCRMSRALVAVASIALFGAACSGDDDDGDDTTKAEWRVIDEGLPAALLSVWGTGPDDVWAVGGDLRDGSGPLVVHYDGAAWSRVATGADSGDLWWVYGFAGGPIFMGGTGGRILKYEGGSFTAMQTPSQATVFGIWGSSASDVWAVGGELGTRGGFAWRNDGSNTWTPEPTLPVETASTAAVWKVFGTSANDVWLVGSGSVSFQWNGTSLVAGDTGVGGSLFTVHGRGTRYAAVGGLGSGVIVEYDGASWRDVTPPSAVSGMSGVVLGEGEGGYAVGQFGSVFQRDATGWNEEPQALTAENLHAVWMDPTGGVWSVGGRTAAVPLVNGVMIYKGTTDVPSGGL